jgi:hypothetical protein
MLKGMRCNQVSISYKEETMARKRQPRGFDGPILGTKKDSYALVTSASGDWEGLYKNGVLLSEGHSIHIEDLFELLELDFEQLEAKEDWVEERGDLPEKLEEVVLR